MGVCVSVYGDGEGVEGGGGRGIERVIRAGGYQRQGYGRGRGYKRMGKRGGRYN